MYDLVFVEPAPLPPHERTWRHPSELGPTKHDVDVGSRSNLAVLIVGACAVLAVASLVVVATPRPTSNPLAITATTSPFVRAITAAPTAISAGARRAPAPAQPTVGLLLSSFTAYPHAIASSEVADLDGTDVADELPDDSAMVLVRTDKVTYRVKWAQVPMLATPDGTVVFDLDGDVVARVSGGVLQRLVDD